ncbi:MAG: pyrimidine reductase [Acidimicrobiales bacterium]|nr:pyrimidine reductase [Acidimicrobiales bacterium]
MAILVSNFFISVDGVVERPDQWHFPFFDEEMGAVVSAGMATAGAFLMGRTLYGEWSEYWPAKNDAEGFGPFINGIKKYVISSSLSEATWNNTDLVTGDDIADRVRAIKDRTEGTILMSGSATTVRWLLANGLLDELHLLVHPVAVGHGQRLFEGVEQPLELRRSASLASGVLNVVYAPA